MDLCSRFAICLIFVGLAPTVHAQEDEARNARRRAAFSKLHGAEEAEAEPKITVFAFAEETYMGEHRPAHISAHLTLNEYGMYFSTKDTWEKLKLIQPDKVVLDLKDGKEPMVLGRVPKFPQIVNFGPPVALEVQPGLSLTVTQTKRGFPVPGLTVKYPLLVQPTLQRKLAYTATLASPAGGAIAIDFTTRVNWNPVDGKSNDGYEGVAIRRLR
jgi:hypothetical protein